MENKDIEEYKKEEEVVRQEPAHWVEMSTSMMKKRLDDLGYGYDMVKVPDIGPDGKQKVDKDGKPMFREGFRVTYTPPEEEAVLAVLHGGDKAMYKLFDGLPELKVAYDMEIEAIGGEGCSPCKKNSIRRKYIELARRAIKNSRQHDAKVNTNKDGQHSGSVEVPGSGSAGQEGAGKRKGLLRKAADYFKKVFRHSAR